MVKTVELVCISYQIPAKLSLVVVVENYAAVNYVAAARGTHKSLWFVSSVASTAVRQFMNVCSPV